MYITSKKFVHSGTVVLVFILLFGFSRASGFGVLTHEAIIDAAWDKSIEPLLKERFPGATAEDLIKARAYAYGGAIMPDMGYFPFGNIFFTNLAHYTRTGDFVMNLLSEAQGLNEFAFALGALAHYTADRDGHPGAVNLSVSMVYPKDKREFGDTVDFEENPIDHRRMEFGFDVLQVARGKYAPISYHRFIGFEVSQPLLERAFMLTYGLALTDVYADLPLSINTFRWSVKSFMPQITNAAWISRKKIIESSQPGISKKQFTYSISRKQYRKEWGKNYHNPGVESYTIGMIIKIMPKVWVTRILKFKAPTQPAEALFIKTFDRVVSDYSAQIRNYETKSLHLDDINYDTGKKTAPCEYNLVDETYKELLFKLPSHPVALVNEQLRKNLLDFFKTYSPDLKNEKEAKSYSDAISWLKAVE